jgi:hypothetical protein
MPRGGLRDDNTNVEPRLTRLEQILPMLAKKTDVETAIAAAVAPLATKEELAVVSNGLRAEIRAAADYTVHRVTVLMDEMSGEVRTYADRLVATQQRAEGAHERIDRLERSVDARLTRLEASRAKRR